MTSFLDSSHYMAEFFNSTGNLLQQLQGGEISWNIYKESVHQQVTCLFAKVQAKDLSASKKEITPSQQEYLAELEVILVNRLLRNTPKFVLSEVFDVMTAKQLGEGLYVRCFKSKIAFPFKTCLSKLGYFCLSPRKGSIQDFIWWKGPVNREQSFDGQ